MKVLLIVVTIFLGGWKIETFVDAFGDKTAGGNYLNSGNIRGKYQSNMLGRGDAILHIVITKKREVQLFLYREFFGSTKVTAYLKANYNIQVKNKGQLLKFWGSMYPRGDRIHLDNSQRFINLLIKSNTFRIVIIDTTDGESFLFKVNANGFVRGLKKLK